MSLPAIDFLGIGAQRAGTTWLWKCLRRHPDLYLPAVKELHYFDRPPADGHRQVSLGRLRTAWFGRGNREHASHRHVADPLGDIKPRSTLATALGGLADLVSFRRSGSWDDVRYLRQFEAGAGKVKGEITPAYALLDDEGVRHAVRLSNDLKVIFILRDPLSRALSSLRLRFHRSEKGLRPPPGDTAKYIVSKSVTDRGDYLRTIDTWGRHIPAERFFIGWYDDTLTDPEGMLRKVMVFLGVDPESPQVLALAHKRFNRAEIQDTGVPAEAVRGMAREMRPLIAAMKERLGGHAIGWLERCDRVIAGEPHDG